MMWSAHPYYFPLPEAAVPPLAIADPYRGLDPADENWLRQQTERVRGLFRRTADDLIQIGAIIAEVKDRLGHGYYLSWVADALPFSADTADRMMKVAAAFGGEIPQRAEFDSTALYLLAQPAVPQEAREMALKLAGDGHRITAAAARKIIRQTQADPETAAPKPPRTAIPHGLLLLLIPEGEREVRWDLTLRFDQEGDLIVGVGPESGRDLAAVLGALAERVRQPAAAPPPAVDPQDHLDWCDGVAGGIAQHFGFSKGRDRQRWEEIQGAGREALMGCCRRFDATVVRPDSTVTDAFRGWAHQSVRGACQREAKRERSGGTFRTKRDSIPDPVVVSLGADD